MNSLAFTRAQCSYLQAVKESISFDVEVKIFSRLRSCRKVVPLNSFYVTPQVFVFVLGHIVHGDPLLERCVYGKVLQ